MLRFLIRLIITPLAIAFIDLFVLIPLVLATFDVVRGLWQGQNIQQPMDVVEGMGVILIGWGVALEERGEIREIFGLLRVPDHARQRAIDHGCHSTGIGLLIFGLFAEMCIEAIRLPNHIVYTKGIDPAILGLGAVFMAICVYVLVRHLVMLAVTMFRNAPAASHAPD